MDLTKFDTYDAAEEGRDLHLRHPIYGHPLYVGPGADDQGKHVRKSKPVEAVTVKVRGMHSEAVKAHSKARRAAALKNGEASDDDGDDLLDVLVTGWSNITGDDGQPARCNRAGKIKHLRANPDFEAQVVAFAGDQANFFDMPAKG